LIKNQVSIISIFVFINFYISRNSFLLHTFTYRRTKITHLCEQAVFKDQAYAKQSVTTQIACRVTGQHTGRSVCKFMLIGTYQ